MKSKKKLIIKIAAVTLAVILLCVGSFGGYLLYRFNCDISYSDYDYSLIYEQNAPSYDVSEDGKFTVLKINDTHFYNGTCEDDKHTLSYLKNVLKLNPLFYRGKPFIKYFLMASALFGDFVIWIACSGETH